MVIVYVLLSLSYQKNAQKIFNPITMLQIRHRSVSPKYASQWKTKLLGRMTSQPIYAHGVSQCNHEERVPLPTVSTCNQRATSPVPRVLDHLSDIPVVFTQTVSPNSEEFLIYDNGRNIDNRFLVFANREGLRHVTSADIWMVTSPLLQNLQTT